MVDTNTVNVVPVPASATGLRGERAAGETPGLTLLASTVGYLCLFAVLCFPVVRQASRAIPLWGNPSDSRYLVWSHAWVAHALVTQPLRLFDANINYPAPLQLSGSEHSLSNQLIFLPIYELTGNPLLALNVLALLSYPAAALAMQVLLIRLGCRAWPAWVAGLIFALGPLYVLVRLERVRYLAIYFPLVALALIRLRETPKASSATLFALVLAMGLLCSYYLAAMLCVTAFLWGLLELFRGGNGRLRFASLAILVAAIDLAMLGVLSAPYLKRSVYNDVGTVSTTVGGFAAACWSSLTSWVARRWASRDFSSCLSLGLAAVAVAALWSRALTARRAVIAGLVVTAVAVTLQALWGEVWTLVPALRFFRNPARLLTLSGFGAALLAGGALDFLDRRLGRVLGGSVVAVVALVVILAIGSSMMVGVRPVELNALSTRATAYRTVGAVARRFGVGPLLELPIYGRVAGGSFEADSMVGSTLHWLPLLGGFTSYQPPHRLLLLQTLARLPARYAIEDLVDMTHLRWILLRPRADWLSRAQRARLLDGLMASGMVRAVWQLERSWTLLQLERPPQHPEWFSAIVSGDVPGQTVLGTRLGPLPKDARKAALERMTAPMGWRVGMMPLPLKVEVRNVGTEGWPAAVPAPGPLQGALVPWWLGNVSPYAVQFRLRWLQDDGTTLDDPALPSVQLRRDVPPGDVLEQDLLVGTPSTPGSYILEVGLQQGAGEMFDVVGTIRVRVHLTPPPG